MRGETVRVVCDADAVPVAVAVKTADSLGVRVRLGGEAVGVAGSETLAEGVMVKVGWHVAEREADAEGVELEDRAIDALGLGEWEPGDRVKEPVTRAVLEALWVREGGEGEEVGESRLVAVAVEVKERVSNRTAEAVGVRVLLRLRVAVGAKVRVEEGVVERVAHLLVEGVGGVPLEVGVLLSVRVCVRVCERVWEVRVCVMTEREGVGEGEGVALAVETVDDGV